MDWKFKSPENICANCNNLLVNLPFFSGLKLLENSEDISREDFCKDCWANVNKEEFFSFWETHIPEKEESETKFLSNTDRLLHIFKNIRIVNDDAASYLPLALKLRYIVSLLLIRKRIFVLVETVEKDGYNIMKILHKREEIEYEIKIPDISDTDFQALRDTLLNKILPKGK